MPSPKEKLAQSLQTLERLQALGRVAIRSADISRTHRERLLNNGFLKEVMKGWYIAARPDELEGESTSWYASYWSFCSDYLQERFGEKWCLSPEQSISLHAGNRTVPKQLIVRSVKGSNNITYLVEDTSIFDLNLSPPLTGTIRLDGLNVYKLSEALLACSANYFQSNSTDARAALSAVSDASELLARLLEGGHSIIAGRLAGGFRNIGRDKIADDIINTMRSAGFDCREEDPFKARSPLTFSRIDHSPYVNRIRLMWDSMRLPVLKNFRANSGAFLSKSAYLKHVQEIYITDAYHSLSIEGYKVSRELIDRVQKGNWRPDLSVEDREQSDALAARGYWLAYQSVRESVKTVLSGDNAGKVAEEDHRKWYRELFLPSISAGLLKPADLAGYRSDQVYIRYSKYLPPRPEAVREIMPAFFELLTEEKEPSVRIILGHFLFVYIHPYMDGNGRIGRFLMNLMLASGGYPWTVIPVELRSEYITALESASVAQDIVPLSRFISGLVDKTVKGKASAK